MEFDAKKYAYLRVYLNHPLLGVVLSMDEQKTPYFTNTATIVEKINDELMLIEYTNGLAEVDIILLGVVDDKELRYAWCQLINNEWKVVRIDYTLAELIKYYREINDTERANYWTAKLLGGDER